MSKGWISLYRQIEDCWLWADKPFAKGQAWIDLLLLANREDKKGIFDGQLIVYKKGVVYRSILFLAERWGWNRKTVKRFLDVLERDGMVVTDASTHGTTITIVNYSNFQCYGSTEWTTDGTTTGQPRDINNNKPIITNNNINNIRGESKRFTPPSVEEVANYCNERGNGINPESFIDYYSSQKWKKANGRPLTDWKAAVRTWERREVVTSEQKKDKVKQTQFNNFHQRDYDYAKLEEKLFR